MNTFSVAILSLLISISSGLAETIDDYEFFGLTWGATISTLHELFPKAVLMGGRQPRGIGVQTWIFHGSDKKIGDVSDAKVSFYEDKLYMFELKYDTTKKSDWKGIFTRLKTRFGEPDPGYAQEGFELIYRWTFSNSQKVIFLTPPQGFDHFTTVEMWNAEVDDKIEKPKKKGEGF